MDRYVGEAGKWREFTHYGAVHRLSVRWSNRSLHSKECEGKNAPVHLRLRVPGWAAGGSIRALAQTVS